MTAHHVIIADDHPLFRDALKQTLGSALPGAAITEVGSVEKLLEALSSKRERRSGAARPQNARRKGRCLPVRV